ncbi:MAG: glycoside hydrolase family 31 protein [bacterium]
MKKRRDIEYVGVVRSAKKTRTGLSLELEPGVAEVFFYSPEIARVRVARKSFEPDSSWAVVHDAPSRAVFSTQSDDHEWTLETSALSVRINRDPFRIIFFDRSQRCLSCDAVWGGVGWRGDGVFCEKTSEPAEHFYGFGEKTFPLDRSGSRMAMWNTDHPFNKPGSDPLYVSIPFFIGLHSGAAYGIFFDSPWKSAFDLRRTTRRTSRGTYSYSAEGGELNYYFIAGPDIKNVISRYTWLTGRMPLPPRWSIGYHQSRWSYKNEQKMRRIAVKFRELGVPIDAAHFDIHYMDNYKVFTWDAKRFPDPKGLATSLAEIGCRAVTIVDPGVKIEKGYNVYDEGMEGDYYCREAAGGYFRGIVWPGKTVFPDFTRGDVREWWAGRVAEFMKEFNVSGIWNDMNEPSVNINPTRRITTDGMLHGERSSPEPHLKLRNVYGLTEAMATRAGQLSARPEERPFLLTRSGYAGIQRYAAVWSGDNTSSWEHLRLSIPLLCGLGLSGVPFVGADIGGFHGNCSPELYARWIQTGVFYPFCRTHTMLATRPQEPWSFGARVAKIAKEYITLRYKLMPYVYNSFRESAETGLPVMRALPLEFPNDEPCLTIEDEFMFGPALLVAPVVTKGATRRDVYLPPGEWIDYYTGERMAGSAKIQVLAPLEKLPLFIRSGYIIPTTVASMFEGERAWDPLMLNVEIGAGASLSLYEDDGKSFECSKGNYSLIDFVYEEENGGCAFVMKHAKSEYITSRGCIVARFRGVKSFPERVTVNGKTIYEAWSEAGDTELPINGWRYDSKDKTLRVGFPDKKKQARIEVVF